MTRPPGFTLVEVLIVSLLLLVLGGALLTLFLAGQTSYLSAEAYLDVQQQARRALDTLIRELHEAGPSGTINVIANGTPGSNQLNFQIAREYNNAVSCPNAICWGSEAQVSDWIHYAVVQNAAVPAPNNLQLVRCITAGAGSQNTVVMNGAGCRVLANNVRTANFNVAGGAVTMTFELQYQHPSLPGGVQTTGPLTMRVRLRNS